MGLVVLPNGELATPEEKTLAVAPMLKPGTSAIENFYQIRFESKEDAERWIDKCIVRWDWVIGLHDATPYDEERTWIPQARRIGGAIHDTRVREYAPVTGDVKLNPYVQVAKVQDKCFAIVGKF